MSSELSLITNSHMSNDISKTFERIFYIFDFWNLSHQILAFFCFLFFFLLQTQLTRCRSSLWNSLYKIQAEWQKYFNPKICFNSSIEYVLILSFFLIEITHYISKNIRGQNCHFFTNKTLTYLFQVPKCYYRYWKRYIHFWYKNLRQLH